MPHRYFWAGSSAQVIDTGRGEMMARQGRQESGVGNLGDLCGRGVKRKKKVEEGRWRKIGGDNWKK